MSSRLTVTTITITTITLVTTCMLGSAISKYGVTGTLRYIWEGDHLSPESRESVDTLDGVESKIKKQTKKLEKIEIMVEVERLNSVDDGYDNSEETKVPQSKNGTLSISSSLAKDVSILSSTLDRIAGEIDSVQSHGDLDIKKRKKEFSKLLVSMMDKVDRILKECGVE